MREQSAPAQSFEHGRMMRSSVRDSFSAAGLATFASISRKVRSIAANSALGREAQARASARPRPRKSSVKSVPMVAAAPAPNRAQ